MPPLPEESDPSIVASDLQLEAERRRPGRQMHVAAELLPLLRFRPAPDVEETSDSELSLDQPPDRLSSARGVIIGVLLVVPFWLVCGLAAYQLFRRG